MKLLTFVLLAISFFLLFGFSATDFSMPKRTKTLRHKVKAVHRKQRNNFVASTIREVQQIVIMQGLAGGMVAVWGSAIGLTICGVAFCNIIGNHFMIPVMAAVCMYVPFLFVKAQWRKTESQIAEELETALNSITTTYMRGDNTFLSAVEENFPYFMPPVSELFRLFVVQSTLIDSNTIKSLNTLKSSVHNVIFREWIDAVIRCQNDPHQKATLPGILIKYSDARTLTREAEVLINGPKHTFFFMIIVSVLAPFLLLLINKDWWQMLVASNPGKILMALSFFVISVTFFAGMNALQLHDIKGGQPH
ncbi:MAG: hypothetical protein PHZ05_03290 [Pygmaiobacter massiliensis]|nr:hypothetical protein [Pygmaiobacter massiliensis]